MYWTCPDASINQVSYPLAPVEQKQLDEFLEENLKSQHYAHPNCSWPPPSSSLRKRAEASASSKTTIRSNADHKDAYPCPWSQYSSIWCLEPKRSTSTGGTEMVSQLENIQENSSEVAELSHEHLRVRKFSQKFQISPQFSGESKLQGNSSICSRKLL